MALIIALGSNLKDRLGYLTKAKNMLDQLYEFEHQSRVYTSKAVEYTEQPDFYNQVIQYKLPSFSAEKILEQTMKIEALLGRTRTINKGPRTIDIDIIFYGFSRLTTDQLTLPHPAWSQRSFVVLPLQELPFFKKLANREDITIPDHFHATATPLN